MKIEVENLKLLINQTKENCFSSTTSEIEDLNRLGIWRPYPAYRVKGYIVREDRVGNETCGDIGRAELPFTKLFYDRQFGERFERDCYRDGHF